MLDTTLRCTVPVKRHKNEPDSACKVSHILIGPQLPGRTDLRLRMLDRNDDAPFPSNLELHGPFRTRLVRSLCTV
jgi:hypothetical protein